MAKKDKPDDVFEGPGFRMERRGRFIDMQNRRSPEEHKRWIRHLIENRHRFLEDIKRDTEELIALVHKFNSLEVLAQVWFMNSVGNPEEYKEYSFKGRLPFVEHLAIIELRDPAYQIRAVDMPSGNDIERAQTLLDGIFKESFWYYGTEGLDPTDKRPISPLQQLRFDTITRELMVRSPTYFHHWADILRDLFGTDFVREWTCTNLGFDIEEAIKCGEGIKTKMMTKMEDSTKEAREFAERLKRYVSEFKKTGTFTGPEEMKHTVNSIRNMRGKKAKQTISKLVVSRAFYNLHATLSFSAPELASESGVTLASAESFLKWMSLPFGVTPKDYLLPSPTSPIRRRPIVTYNGLYFTAASHLLIWALKPCIEDALRPGAPQSLNFDHRLWERYQKRRSDFLVSRGLKYFQDLLPRAQVLKGLEYEFTEGNARKRFELDGLILYDRYAFLLEGKSGELSPSARRGGQLRLVDDLKKLVEGPHQQALRASKFINSESRPLFYKQDGSTFELDKHPIKQYFMLTLTLEDLDVYTKELYQLEGIGLFGNAELPWALSINDLRIISETLKFPGHFTHYLKWRLHLNHAKQISAQSEIDWLGIYIAEGPKLLSLPPEYDTMNLTTYTTEFDDFYLYEQGERSTPANRPAQFIPDEMMVLLRSLEDIENCEYTATSESFLSLDLEERRRFAEELREFIAEPKKGKPRAEEIQFLGNETVVIIRSSAADRRDLETIATSAANANGRTAIVLVLSESQKGSVVACSVSERPRRPGHF
jgi:hypothetical protein